MTKWGSTALRWAIATALFALPIGASAGQNLDIDILSPVQGTCVNNGDEEPFLAAPGGEAAPAPSEVALNLRITTPDADPIMIDFFVDDGEEPIFTVEYLPDGGGAADVDIYSIPPDFIEDGEDRTLRVVARRDGQTAEDSVTFTLDRAPPTVTFADDVLDVLAECYEDQPDVPYEVADAVDPNPQVQEELGAEGCFDTRVVTVMDSCGEGNVRIVEIATARSAGPADIDVTVQGYRCGADDCVTEGDDAIPFAEGDDVGRGTAVFEVEADVGCVDSVSAEFTVDGGDPEVLVPGAVFEQPGDYVLTISAATCGEDPEPIVETLSFTVVPAPTPVIGVPDNIQEGNGGEPLRLVNATEVDPAFGELVEVAWDLDDVGGFELRGPPGTPEIDSPIFPADEDGTFPVRLRVTTENGGFAVLEQDIVIADVDPTCDAGGPYNGGEGVAVQMNGSGSAAGSAADPIQVYDWDFGDGIFPQRGIDAMPNHIYGEAGEYTVTLRVEDEDSSAECEAQVVIGDDGPIVEGVAALNAENLVEGDSVCFTAGDTRPANGFDPIVDFRWTFGDDSPFQNGPALRGPCHTYNDSGDFEVCLRVQDEDEDIAMECIDITVGDVDPICAFSGPLFLSEGQVGFFDATDSAGAGALDPLRELVWNFGDGSDDVINPPETRDVEHAFEEQGEYTIALTVRDEDSEVTCTQDIIINDVVPTASLVAVLPQGQAEGREGEPITLDASGSRPGSENDPIVSYRWDFGDGTTDETENAIVQHAFADQGVYVVRVTVIDEDGSAVGANTTVNVGNVPPRLSIAIDDAGGDNQVEIGVQTGFTLTVTDVEGDLPPPTVRWDMGDGTTFEDVVQVQHAYGSLGQQTIRVTADDGDGGVAEAELVIDVTPAAPRFERIDPLETCEGQTVQFTLCVDAAIADTPVGCDGPVVLGTRAPENAIIEEVPDAENPDCRTCVNFEWTPTFFDAGPTTVRLTGVGPFTGISRTRDVEIDVCEAGGPILAAAGGSASRGLVTIYRYERNGFTPDAQVEVGLGAADLAIGADGRRGYVAVPGSGAVAAVQLTGDARLLRRVPTGSNTSGVAVGGGYIWAVNAGDNTLSRIDAETLKVDRTIDLAPLDRPIDVEWLPADFPDLDGPRLAIVSARSGHVALVDPASVEADEDGPLVARRLGGALTRVVGDPTTGWLNIIDGKTRMIYRLSAGALESDPDGLEPDAEPVPFAANDLVVDGERVLVATDAGVWVWEGDGTFTRFGENTLAATALADLNGAILPESEFAAAVGDRVENYGGDFNRLIGAAGARIRRMAAVVARE